MATTINKDKVNYKVSLMYQFLLDRKFEFFLAKHYQSSNCNSNKYMDLVNSLMLLFLNGIIGAKFTLELEFNSHKSTGKVRTYLHVEILIKSEDFVLVRL